MKDKEIIIATGSILMYICNLTKKSEHCLVCLCKRGAFTWFNTNLHISSSSTYEENQKRLPTNDIFSESSSFSYSINVKNIFEKE